MDISLERPSSLASEMWKGSRKSKLKNRRYAQWAPAVMVIVLGLVVLIRRELERERMVALDKIVMNSMESASSFRFTMNLTTYLREPYHILSSEECKGAYVRNHKGEYSIHMMTSTSIQAKGEGKKELVTERLMGVGDDWVKYHSAQPESVMDRNTLGKWQDTADLLDDALAALPKVDGEQLADAVTEFLESKNPYTDAEIVFTKVKAAYATWVNDPFVKDSLNCYKVLLHPKFLLDRDNVVFEFSGPGVGISTVGRKAIKDAHVTAEFCANSQGFIESMVTEAIKDGPKGYSVRKEVVVSDYNKPYALPVPRHQDCDMKVQFRPLKIK